MPSRRLVVAVVLAVIAAPVGVGAASSSAISANAGDRASMLPMDNATDAPSLGQSISAMMQSSTAQAAGTVENGMWAAAYANASNASTKRALVEQRTGQLNTTVSELRAQHRALQTAYRNGSINRTTYLARLSTVVGRLAALDEGIQDADERGAEIGVNRSRLQELRDQARNLSGPEISRLARNLSGGQDPPGPSGLFDRGRPDQNDDRAPENATNRSAGNQGSDNRGGPDGNTTDGSPGKSEASGNTTQGTEGGQDQSNSSETTQGDEQGASNDEGKQSADDRTSGDETTATATPTGP